MGADDTPGSLASLAVLATWAGALVLAATRFIKRDVISPTAWQRDRGR
jgi:hypothetical protein